MPRSLPTYCLASVLSLSLLTGVTTPSIAGQINPTMPPVTRPESPPTAPKPPTDQAQMERFYQEYGEYQAAVSRYYVPPLSRVDSNAGEVYSRHINRIVCAVDAPTGGNSSQQTWLGTRLGIKRVEKNKGVVRTYSQRDGLPGDLIEDLAVDKDGAVALVRLPDNNRTLCWWDKQTDRWREITRLPPQPGGYGNGADSSWRFVMTPTRLVLVPPRIETTYNYPGKGPEVALGGQISVWRRDDLQAGRGMVQAVFWEPGLMSSDRNGLDNRFITNLSAIGETVFLGGAFGLIAVPEATLANPPSQPDDKASVPLEFLSATPSMPQFLRGTNILSLTVRDKTLYALMVSSVANGQKTELAVLTPVVRDGMLQGIRQTSTLAPNLGLIQSYQYPRSNPDIVFVGGDPWVVGDTGFLHRIGTTWERRDVTGKVVPLEPVDEPLGKHSAFDFSEDSFPFAAPVFAPTASDIPDAVAQAWVGSGTEAGPYSGSRRRVAWIRQRFPYFYSATASIALPGVSPYPPSAVAQKRREPPLFGGSIVSFVPDPQLPDTVWYAPSSITNHQTFLWRLSARTLPQWQWTSFDGTTVPYVLPTLDTTGEAIALPAQPVRAHLSVYGLAAQPDSVFVGTRNGILRIPTTSLKDGKDKSAGATWVPQETQQGTKTQVFVSGKLYQAGPDATLFINQNDYQQPLSRYDAGRKQFIRLTDSLSGQVTAASRVGIFLNLIDVVKTGNSVYYSQGNKVRFIPFGKDGMPNASAAVSVRLSLPDPKRQEDAFLPVFGAQMPFEVSTPDRIGATGSTLWFSGNIKKPLSPRYSRNASGNSNYYGIAGYDLVRKRWTRLLELPEQNGSRQGAVTERDGKAFATFQAPDHCVWRYDAEQDTWTPIAPALPPDALPDRNYNRAPYLWNVRGGDVWLLTTKAVYHHASGSKAWSQLPTPDILARLQSSSSEPPYMAAVGNNLLIGSNTGLWCFDTQKRTWNEIAPLAARLPETPVDSFVRSVAADQKSVYVSGTHQVDGSGRNDGFLLVYDKKGGWMSPSPDTLALPRFAENDHVHFDGKAVWYMSGEQTRRRDPRTGLWMAVPGVAGRERRQVVRVPDISDAVFLVGVYRVERYDETTGEIKTLLDTITFDTGTFPIPPRGTQIWSVTVYRGGLLAATTTGVYRLSLAGSQGERLPLPSLEYASMFTDTNDDVYAWDMNSIVHLPK